MGVPKCDGLRKGLDLIRDAGRGLCHPPGGAGLGLFFFFSLKHVTVSGIIIVVLKGESYKRDGLLLLEEHIIITIEIKGDR